MSYTFLKFTKEGAYTCKTHGLVKQIIVEQIATRKILERCGECAYQKWNLPKDAFKSNLPLFKPEI